MEQGNAEISTLNHFCPYGFNVLRKHLQSMTAEIDGVISAEDIECIHHMRVASRRLRNALDIFQSCFRKKEYSLWLNKIKKITRSLGEARDLDVQLELLQAIQGQCPDVRFLPGLRRLSLRLSQKRNALQKEVTQIMQEFKTDDTIQRLSFALQQNQLFEPAPPYSAELYQLGHEVLSKRLQRFLEYEDIIHLPEKKEELHQMRIAAKWLRYSMEVFSPLYSNKLKTPLKAAREAQEFLGKIHDNDVWMTFLPAWMEKEKKRTLEYYGYLRPFYRLLPGVQYFLATRIEEREMLYKEFLKHWEQWQRINLWERLEKTLTAPLLNPYKIFPPSGYFEDNSDSQNPQSETSS